MGEKKITIKPGTGVPVVSKDIDIPAFKPSIPEYMFEGMDSHDKFMVEQISCINQQNEWQTDMVYKIYNYTKTINGKVVELEHFRQRLNMELEMDEKWDLRQQEQKKYKKWMLIGFLGILYPLYLTIVNHIGLVNIIENLIKL